MILIIQATPFCLIASFIIRMKEKIMNIKWPLLNINKVTIGKCTSIDAYNLSKESFTIKLQMVRPIKIVRLIDRKTVFTTDIVLFRFSILTSQAEIEYTCLHPFHLLSTPGVEMQGSTPWGKMHV